MQHHFQNNWDGIPTPTEKQGQGGLSVGPYLNNTVTFAKAGYYRTTDFHYGPVSLHDYAGTYPQVHRLLDHFEKGRFCRADGFIDLRGDPSVLLRHLYDPHPRPEMWPRYLQLKADEFLITALERLHPTKSSRSFKLSATLEDKARLVEGLLQAQYMEPLSLGQLARLAGTNREYLRRAFKARTGQTIIDYLTWVRIEKAKDYLVDTTLDLDSIAVQTDFCDGDRLGKVFKQLTGHTPMSFRGYGRKRETLKGIIMENILLLYIYNGKNGLFRKFICFYWKTLPGGYWKKSFPIMEEILQKLAYNGKFSPIFAV